MAAERQRPCGDGASVAFVAACNDDAVLAACLAGSPDVASGAALHVVRGASSAAEAYNEGLRRAAADVIVFAHQDVFLPPGWLTGFRAALAQLADTDPDWGVVGVYGLTLAGEPRGWVYSTGVRRLLGEAFARPQEVRTLDEVLLALRVNSGISFDDALPGYHLYGTDVCLEAERRGLHNYVVPCPVLHNSNGVRQLPAAFWRAYASVRRKWKGRLPVYAPCVLISRSPAPAVWQMIWRLVHFAVLRRKVGQRVPNPAALCRDLIASGCMPART